MVISFKFFWQHVAMLTGWNGSDAEMDRCLKSARKAVNGEGEPVEAGAGCLQG